MDKKDKKENIARKEMTIIGVILFVLLLTFIVFIKYNRPKEKVVKNKEIKQIKEVKKENDIQKQIVGIPLEKIREEKIKNKTLTKEYKKYMSLEKENKNKQQVVPRETKISIKELENIKKKIKYKNNSKLPKKFNLNSKINLNQKDHRLSWDFASLKSLETNINLKHNNTLNLSEAHLDYVESNIFDTNRNHSDGGSFSLFEDYSLKYGAADENEIPNKDYTNEEAKNFISKNLVASATETVNYPSGNEFKGSKLKEYLNVIKKHIMTNGSLYSLVASIDNDREYYNDETSSLYFSGNYNLLNNENLYNAVSIVGFDDNYSKDNFKIKPTNDGAFIALNSKDNEYIYISYEDKLVTTDLNGVINTNFDSDGYIKLEDIKTDKIKEVINDNLKKYIKNINNTEYISKIALNSIYSLDLSDSDLIDENLDDIKLFKNVRYLNLSNNNISDVSKLKSNYYLTIDLSSNKEIKGLENLNIGYSLILKDSKITSLPLTLDIDGYLDLSYNPDINLSTIPSTIKYLNLSNCDIDSLADLPKLSNLEELNLSNNKIENVAILNDLSFNRYASINLSKNQIEDISVLNPINAYSFDLSNNKVHDISSFDNDFITILDLSGNNIKKLSPLKNLDNLESLILKNMKIKSLDKIKKLKTLKDLDLSENEIEDSSELSNFKYLESLSLSKNKNIKIDFESETLKYLNIEDSNINNFDTNKFTNIEYLNISSNKVNNLDNIINSLKENSYISINNILTINDLIKIGEKAKDKNIYIDNMNINIDYKVKENVININEIDYLKDIINNDYYHGYFINNGKYKKDSNIIKIKDLSNNKVIINKYFNYNNININKIIINLKEN